DGDGLWVIDNDDVLPGETASKQSGWSPHLGGDRRRAAVMRSLSLVAVKRMWAMALATVSRRRNRLNGDGDELTMVMRSVEGKP
ncbi:hypothetical protein Dimus_026869, partial [Dionaea muscipula]